MSDFTRYAIYYLPPDPLARFGAAWLGWDVEVGQAAPHPVLGDIPADDIAQATATPRKYGFHGTLKPPFRLAPGTDAAQLIEAAETLAKSVAPATCDGLRLARLGHFLALVPAGDTTGIARVAGACVAELDPFRAPPSQAELTRRRKAGLSPTQEAMLAQWGYPYVFEEFRFHLTLSGRLAEADADRLAAALGTALPDLPSPFIMDRVSLVGETPDGFKLIRHLTLAG